MSLVTHLTIKMLGDHYLKVQLKFYLTYYNMYYDLNPGLCVFCLSVYYGMSI